MARRKISTTVYLTIEQHEALQRLHERTKVPIAEYVRAGVDIVLERAEAAQAAERGVFAHAVMAPALPEKKG